MDPIAFIWPEPLVPLRDSAIGALEAPSFVAKFAQTTQRHQTLIVTVATREVLPVLEIWVAHAERLLGVDIAVLAGDQATADRLAMLGTAHLLIPIPDMSAHAGYTSATGFRARGLLSTALKFPMIQAALAHWQTVILSDLDALILRDPTSLIADTTDVAFQRDASYPKPMVDAWVFADCSGFLFFQNSPPTKELLASAR